MIDEALHIVRDPGHLLAEFIFFVFEVVVLGLFAPKVVGYFKKLVKREHLIIDAEHGVEHGDV